MIEVLFAFYVGGVVAVAPCAVETRNWGMFLLYSLFWPAAHAHFLLRRLFSHD